MAAKQKLPARGDCFLFEHKTSEVNYGGGARFHQAAFPPTPPDGADLEAQVFQAVSRFAELLQLPTKSPELTPLPGAEWTHIYFDQWGETPRLSAAAFGEWIGRDLAAVAEAYRRVRVNAVAQEKSLGLPRLGYLVSLAAVTLVSALISEFFEQQLERLGPLATHARLTLGRCLTLALRAAEADPELRQRRTESFGHPDPEAGCWRVLNPFSLGFADTADTGLMEELLAGSNPYRVSSRLRGRLLTLVGQVLAKSRKFEAADVRRSLAEPAALELWLRSFPDRRRLVRELRKQRDLAPQLVLENVQTDLRDALRRLAVQGPTEELLPYVANDRQLGELLQRAAVRARLFKALKARRSPQVRDLKLALRAAQRRLARSRRRFWGRLTFLELQSELAEGLRRLTVYLAETEDFRQLRAHYGRDTNRSLDWQGLRLWRAYELGVAAPAAPGEPSVRLVPVWEQRRADVENAFAEGNLFLCRGEGDIYPPSHRRRSRTLFLFADLRNSTETTMKLTKDTASFLAPYLTAVDAEARAAGGERIYFAGDGYAAHYAKATAAVRAAYAIAGRFSKLRQTSTEEQRRKAKDILQTMRNRALDWHRPAALQKAWQAASRRADDPEWRDLLAELVAFEPGALTEEGVKQALLKVAEEYSMPRIDAGIAITEGELFLALVGEEGEAKTPIVISPALTQAARLSGSSEVVKRHLDEKFHNEFPFNAQIWEQKLYNRGIVVTEDLVEEVRGELEIKPLKTSEPRYASELFLYYIDPQLKRRIILRDLIETVSLKGIKKACRIFEVCLPFSPLDKQFGEPN